MSLFSLFRKNKPDSDPEDNAYRARTEIASDAQRPRRRKSGTNGSGIVSDGGAPIDPVLPEKKRARRRLVGAVALVLAVIIGVPMILDSEPKPLPDDLTIEIPSKVQQTPAASPPIAKKPEIAPELTATSSRAASAELDRKEEMIDPGSKSGSGASIMQPSSPALAGDATGHSSDPAAISAKKPETKAVNTPAFSETRTAPAVAATKKKSETAVSTPVVTSPAAKASAGSDSARAMAILEDAPTSVPRPGKFTVQVAALASTDKVNELRDKLKNAGIASYTEKIATGDGERIRIRIGPLNSREEAEKQRIKLGALGLSGTVVPSSP